MKELGKEVKLASEEIKKEEKIDKITGFENEQQKNEKNKR